ncbi:MAG: DUF3570 domain-containing protein [Gammaproteobacteria bacterium]|nr:DUF3570 domain-containing protein [Gammaproteobacteria bacterium]
MQLDKKQLLALATASLLGSAPAHGENTQGEALNRQDDNAQAATSKWRMETGLLYYDEKERVTAVEPVFAASKTWADGSRLSFKAVLDSLTGASHNGASVADTPQTFSGPSGKSSYTVPAGEVPLDDTFKDTRGAFSVQWSGVPEDGRTWSAGGNVSAEYDFKSLTVNGGFSQEFNKKNTTLNLGVSVERDWINPVGDSPEPLSLYSDQLKAAASEDKIVTDLMVGVTQVINRSTIMQFNLGYSRASGYLTDPYKVVSVLGLAGQPLDYLYENRPDSRSKMTVYWQARHHLEEDIVDVSYRYLSDDWGIRSHTLDFHYRWQAENFYIQPHLRFYRQSAADFYRVNLDVAPLTPGGPLVIDPATLPAEVSADYRLADLDTRTVGVKFGMTLAEETELSFRLEYYQQSGDTKPADLDATIFQVGYSFWF